MGKWIGLVVIGMAVAGGLLILLGRWTDRYIDNLYDDDMWER